MGNVRRAINHALSSTTGYRLTKTRSDRAPSVAIRRDIAALSAQIADFRANVGQDVNTILKRAVRDAASTAASGPKERPAKAAGTAFPKDFDDDVVKIIGDVRPYTMTGIDKLHALISATRYVARYGVPGAIVECGVWRGGSMHAVARTLDGLGVHDRDLYLYDTFEGMTSPTEKDVRFDGELAANRLAESSRETSMVWAYASLEDVKAGFEQVPYPADRVHYVKGPVETTIPAELPEQISILRLDTDWYESTAHELAHMYDRLVPGGVLMIDDYGWWQGSRKATDEFLERTGEPLLLLRMASGRVAVKR